ncbi:MarR family winged helix-turn-helix transcriptional regulator [Pseudooceanicola algae]|uniref:HTH marR-type domain-containing protein n=1 Tax=Pseudooceanicola algae TaxID=1537215 RepID=A0A7T1BRU1_9RHOB|nr:MarR family transcriptional regulator [Pseudooceanicola algae]QPM89203.1 hypothetical protein PSAL_004180 [Pseudooceanicola algae]
MTELLPDPPKTPDQGDQIPAPTEALICFNLYAASHAFIRLYTPHLDRLALTYPQFLVLLLLHDRDGQQVGELGRALSMETNTLSPLLKRLGDMGLITRQRSKKDARRVAICLTDAGRTKATAVADVPGCIAREKGLSADGYRHTLEMLKALRGWIDASPQA